jgi:hypothetical protein
MTVVKFDNSEKYYDAWNWCNRNLEKDTWRTPYMDRGTQNSFNIDDYYSISFVYNNDALVVKLRFA